MVLMKRYKQSRIGQGSAFVPLAAYYDVPVERGGILKVVMAVTQWLRDAQTNLFMRHDGSSRRMSLENFRLLWNRTLGMFGRPGT
jgi:hypothetical protein